MEKKHDYYRGNYVDFSFNGEMSPIRSIVYQLMIGMVADKLKEETIKNYFSGQMIDENGAIKNKTEDLIKNAIPIAINTYFENISRNMVNQLQMTIMSNSQLQY